MSNFQVCLCGAAPGYPHAADCPYPLYHGTQGQQARWEKDRQALRRTATPVWSEAEAIVRKAPHE